MKKTKNPTDISREHFKHCMLLKHSVAVRHLNDISKAKLVVLEWFKHTDKSSYVKVVLGNSYKLG